MENVFLFPIPLFSFSPIPLLPTSPVILISVADSNEHLKERVRAFWQAHPCGTKFADAEPGTAKFYELVAAHRYAKEWHIPEAANFAGASGLKVLEIGCGLGTDGAQFAKAGADYTGVDLTEAAVELARRGFALGGLKGSFQTADAENLEFENESFDLVYSHGVLHHTPDTARAVSEIWRVLKPGGRALVMLYHRDSYNYRVNISVLRRAGARLLKSESGIHFVHRITGEPLESLREHAILLRAGEENYLKPDEFLSQNTDGAGNPLARVYSREEARELFKEFSHVELRAFFLNKRWLPLLGRILPRSLESQLADRWGWHLWIYATK